MRKIFTIALREYRAMVATKAFLISIIMMPILMSAGIVAMELFKGVGQTRERKLAIIDHSQELFALMCDAAQERNDRINASIEKNSAADSEIPGVREEIYLLEHVAAESVDDTVRFKLSERIRDQDLYAFVEIPEDVLEATPDSATAVKFFSEDSSISLARRWIENLLTEIAREKRVHASGITAAEIARFQQFNLPVAVHGQGLLKKADGGLIVTSQERDVMLTLFLPMGIMMLMFMVIFMAAQPMLESVLEEKSQRIAEVLLGSANPFQLMAGKLLGTVAGSLTIFLIYLLGVYAVSQFRGWTNFVPLEIVPWFVVFQVTGVLFYAAIFMAVGASVSQLKEAQSLLLPVWMLLMAPLFVWIMIVRDPQGPIAKAMSFFPPTAPTTMVLRLATGQSIPNWQPIVALVVTLLATSAVVLIAGRIFRVGILWQGKTPRFSEICRWAFLGE